MILLDTHVLGEPVGQGRPRAVRVGSHVRMHSAPRSSEWQSLAAQQCSLLWRELGQARPHDEPVRLVVDAVGRRPKHVPKRLGRGRRWRETKPDLDNVVKAVADALVVAGVITDDVLVAELVARSLVAHDGESPHVRIVVETLEPWPVVP